MPELDFERRTATTQESPPDNEALVWLTFHPLSPEVRRANIRKAQTLKPGARYDFPGVKPKSELYCSGVAINNLNIKIPDLLFLSGTYVGMTSDGYLLFRGVPKWNVPRRTVEKTRYPYRKNLEGKQEHYFPVRASNHGTEIVPAGQESGYQDDEKRDRLN